jgi:hypothetical protein
MYNTKRVWEGNIANKDKAETIATMVESELSDLTDGYRFLDGKVRVTIEWNTEEDGDPWDDDIEEDWDEEWSDE